MDHRELKKLVQLMNDNGLVELEIEQEGTRVSLRKAGASAAYLTSAPLPSPWPQGPAPAPPPVAAPLAAPPAPGDAALPPAEQPGTRLLRSPMVGTFYRRPNPDAEPYVDVGGAVGPDSVVCIVEAMKVNNEIKAEMEGEVVEVLVEDGQPVEYDQPLFRIRVS